MSVQAAVVSGPGSIALERFPGPHLAPGEALVRMELSGICVFFLERNITHLLLGERRG